MDENGKIIFKAYKYRLYPNKTQETLLAKHFGHSRFLYNHFLSLNKNLHEENKSKEGEKSYLNRYDCQKILTAMKKEEEYEWLKEVNSQSLQYSLKSLDDAYKKFFTKKGGFPKFKKKINKQSFHVPQNVSVVGDKLNIPKFKEGLRFKQHRELKGNIRSCTITKSSTGKYHVSILCEVLHEPKSRTGKQVGIDTGISSLAVLSDGTRYGNLKTLKRSLKRLKHEQRQLSKKVKGSVSRNKQRHRVAMVHERITNIRRDYLHKVTSEIVGNFDFICVEDLSVKNLMKNPRLSQAFSDVALGSFYDMLEYKSGWNGKTFVKIDRFFPSTKTCGDCGHINDDLTLSDRDWCCPLCGVRHDRDLNASRNILTEGIRLQSGLGTNSDFKQKRVEALPLGESMKPEATYFQ